MTKDKIKIEIDLKPIKEDLEKYIKRKLKEKIREIIEYDYDTEVDINFPDIKIKYPHIGERLEKLEDWKSDIEKGWINPNGTKKNE